MKNYIQKYCCTLLFSYTIYIGVTLNRNQIHQNFTHRAASEIEKTLNCINCSSGPAADSGLRLSLACSAAAQPAHSRTALSSGPKNSPLGQPAKLPACLAARSRDPGRNLGLGRENGLLLYPTWANFGPHGSSRSWPSDQIRRLSGIFAGSKPATGRLPHQTLAAILSSSLFFLSTERRRRSLDRQRQPEGGGGGRISPAPSNPHLPRLSFLRKRAAAADAARRWPSRRHACLAAPWPRSSWAFLFSLLSHCLPLPLLP
jgi:hypothetical protein